MLAAGDFPLGDPRAVGELELPPVRLVLSPVAPYQAGRSEPDLRRDVGGRRGTDVGGERRLEHARREVRVLEVQRLGGEQAHQRVAQLLELGVVPQRGDAVGVCELREEQGERLGGLRLVPQLALRVPGALQDRGVGRVRERLPDQADQPLLLRGRLAGVRQAYPRGECCERGEGLRLHRGEERRVRACERREGAGRVALAARDGEVVRGASGGFHFRRLLASPRDVQISGRDRACE